MREKGYTFVKEAYPFKFILTRQNIWQLAESSVDADYDYVLYLQYDKWEFL